MLARRLPASGFARERWRNGAGWTRQVHASPSPAGGFDWRASIAEIDHDCGFSRFEGCDRTLVLIAGDGGCLRFDDGSEHALEPPHGRVRFAGEHAPQCRVDGRLQVFNLIARRDRVQAEVLHRPLVGPMVFLPEPGVSWLVLLLAGRAELPDHPARLLLEQGDALLLCAEPAAPERAVMTGGGEVLLVRVARRPND